MVVLKGHLKNVSIILIIKISNSRETLEKLSIRDLGKKRGDRK